jgi:hypothetical protein
MDQSEQEEHRRAAMRRALEVMTAWLEAKPGVGPDELMWEIIEANVREGYEAEIAKSMGMQRLASILHVKLAVATGQSELEILQDIALRYAS